MANETDATAAATRPRLVENQDEDESPVEIVDAPAGESDREVVTQPQKLMRIASMVRTMLEEVRHAPLDEAGRRMLRQIHDKSLAELTDVLSEDLQEELSDVVLPFTDSTPSESELRIAQAQLVGWLEGLFHGIQASIATQQMMAQAQQAQMEQMRRRALGPGQAPGQPPGRPSGYL